MAMQWIYREPLGSPQYEVSLKSGEWNPHGLKYGKGLITGLLMQWQNGEQVAVWPTDVAKGQLKFPSFIKVTAN